MSMKLRELIRQVRAAKSQSEERGVVAKESASIRDSFKAGENSYRHRNIAKLLYFHLLGYPSSFGQMECVKLCASSKFSEKRIGYLALSLLLEPESEILFLVTNSIKQDLVGTDEFAASAALSLLANCGTLEMCTSLSTQIYDLLLHPNPNLRKKAVIAAVRVCTLAPDDTDKFFFRILSLLEASGQGSAGASSGGRGNQALAAGAGPGAGPGGVTLSVCTALESFLSMRPSLVENFPVGAVGRVLRKIQQGGSGSGEFEFAGGTTDPFVQVGLLRLVRKVGRSESSVEEVLAQTATNTESSKNAGCAVLYECAQTILEISRDATLRTLAINVLGKFLAKQKEDNNMQYVALQALQNAAKFATADSADEKAVQRHRAMILECLNDADISIRRRALEICVRLANEANFKAVSKELLNYLASNAVPDFKHDLVEKISYCAEKFSQDNKQYLDVVLRLSKLAGAFISDQIVDTVLNLVLACSEQVQIYFTVQLLNTTRTHNSTDTRDALLFLTVYCLGEFGHLLNSDLPPAEILEVLEDLARIGLLQGQSLGETSNSGGMHASSSLVSTRSGTSLCQLIATALVKLAAKLPSQYTPRMTGILRKFENSLHPELQQRACEYLVILQHWPEHQRRALLEKMPGFPVGPSFQGRPAGHVLPEELAISARVATSAATAKVDIDDLLGSASDSRKAPVTGADSLLDILGEIAPAETRDEDLQIPSRRIFDKHGLTVDVSGRSVNSKKTLDLVASFRSSEGNVENLVFEVAVPKHLKLTMRPASGNALLSHGARVTQNFLLENADLDNKPVAGIFKFRLSCLLHGRPVAETGQVANLA